MARVRTASPTKLLLPTYAKGIFSVSVQTIHGRSYTLEFKRSGAETSWTALPSVQGDGTLKVLQDPAATGFERLYRLGAE